MLDRTLRLLDGVDIDREIGLEIGPLDKPLVPRLQGRPIFYADYASREVLQANSSSDPNVDVASIPEIDYLIAPLPGHLDRRFDYIVASHVAEHVPDLIGWCTTLFGWLSAGGRVLLAIPDRRYCFDYLRPTSTVGQLAEAFFERRKRPSFSVIYDAMRQAVQFDTASAWRDVPYNGPFQPIFTREVAFFTANQARRTVNYQDCHCWVFTYESFLESIDEINALGIAPIRLVRSEAPVPGSNEFHVVLAPNT